VLLVVEDHEFITGDGVVALKVLEEEVDPWLKIHVLEKVFLRPHERLAPQGPGVQTLP